ncbi:TPA: hypothetical protein QCS32_006260 [Bacillus thuringiensis]|uniref:Uncharacterized protein n=1 Tax=Bacillus thuringiensis serovar iberica TaxID=180866 RepID=A0A9X6LM05_BACTU|nr:hypothetical protein [Bacillus thuringiensis]MEB9626259.1 hypothetical protein [Bacillus cereus]OUB49470.1 hypothetical protein BK741_12120 [Bacillus thuringiensis serovar iberica]HDR5354428.1 hypothetical protein [Bacillus thuringiensis]
MENMIVNCNYNHVNLDIVNRKVNVIKMLQKQTIELINNNKHELAKKQLIEISEIEKELKELGIELV